MVKVLVVNTNNSTRINGITNVIKNYYYAMDKTDLIIDFAFIALSDERFVNDIIANKGKFFFLPSKNRNPVSYIFRLLKILKEGKYDAIHVHGSSTLIAIELVCARLTGLKQRIAHSHSTSCKYKFLNRALFGIFKASLTVAIACGEAAGKWLYKSEDFIILNNAVDYNKFKYDEDTRLNYRMSHSLEDKVVIGHIGLFYEAKNHKFLINVFNKIINVNKNYHLVLVGDGSLKEEIIKQVNDLNLNEYVTFKGLSGEIPQLLQMMDIFVMPSLFEGFPLVLAEAQCAGLPCFLSDNISREVNLIDRAEFLSLNKHEKEWAEAIINCKIVDRNAIKDSVREKIISKGYDINNEAKRLESIYKGAIIKDSK